MFAPHCLPVIAPGLYCPLSPNCGTYCPSLQVGELSVLFPPLHTYSIQVHAFINLIIAIEAINYHFFISEAFSMRFAFLTLVAQGQEVSHSSV